MKSCSLSSTLGRAQEIKMRISPGLRRPRRQGRGLGSKAGKHRQEKKAREGKRGHLIRETRETVAMTGGNKMSLERRRAEKRGVEDGGEKTKEEDRDEHEEDIRERRV